MMYPSGNRDERVFTDPARFDLARDPNRHLGFGGRGPHYCLGHMLAKTQLKAIFSELVHRVPELDGRRTLTLPAVQLRPRHQADALPARGIVMVAASPLKRTCAATSVASSRRR